MNYIIRYDKDNKEISKEPTHRGRPPKGSSHVNPITGNEDGNLHIKSTNSDISISTGSQHIVSDSVPIAIPVRVIPPNYTKSTICEQKTTLEILLKACKPMSKEVNGSKIILNYPIIVHESGLDVIKFNSVYNKVEIDTERRSVSVWGDLRMPARNIVEGAF